MVNFNHKEEYLCRPEKQAKLLSSKAGKFNYNPRLKQMIRVEIRSTKINKARIQTDYHNEVSKGKNGRNLHKKFLRTCINSFWRLISSERLIYQFTTKEFI